MDKPNYYAIIPAEVRYDESLNANAKLLYGEISALCGKNGICWATNNYFATLYNVSPISISRWIKSLSDNGHIIVNISYKVGTKEIDKRYIQICKEGININAKTPINKNVKENNTSINNTSINNNPIIPLESFEKFWEAYPKKQDKQKTKKWFEKNKPNEELLQTILDKLELFKKTKQWENKQFIPMPTTWLNGKRWEDEIIIEEEETEEEMLERVKKEIEEEKRLGIW